MNDPIIEITLGAAVIATIAAAGGYVGIDPHALLFAGVGAGFGEPAAKSLGAQRKIFVYVGAVLVSSLLATIAAHKFHDGHFGWMGVWAFCIAVGFQPLLAGFIGTIPQIVVTLRDVAIAAIKTIAGRL
jgi:NADH:ubiquinone oxidoreductase subunit 6 (subunit J)